MGNDTILIAGLGNPGKEYEKTRHNLGFVFNDFFLQQRNAQNKLEQKFQTQKKFSSGIASFQDATTGKKVILAKPLTFMNDSGRAIKELLSFYKITTENLLVIHDDLDLPLGAIRVSKNRGAGGHNGIRSIIAALGTKGFTRVRMGISPENEISVPAEHFVLGKFSTNELEIVSGSSLEKAKKAVEDFIQKS